MWFLYTNYICNSWTQLYYFQNTTLILKYCKFMHTHKFILGVKKRTSKFITEQKTEEQNRICAFNTKLSSTSKSNTVFHILSFKRKENPHLHCWPASNWMPATKHQVHCIQKNQENLLLGRETKQTNKQTNKNRRLKRCQSLTRS